MFTHDIGIGMLLATKIHLCGQLKPRYRACGIKQLRSGLRLGLVASDLAQDLADHGPGDPVSLSDLANAAASGAIMLDALVNQDRPPFYTAAFHLAAADP